MSKHYDGVRSDPPDRRPETARPREPASRGRQTPSVLVITRKWPNVLAPLQGLEAEGRVRALQDAGVARYRVIAPTPAPLSPGHLYGRLFAPSRTREVFARGSRNAAVPQLEKRARVIVHHPRYYEPALRFGLLIDPIVRHIAGPKPGLSAYFYRRAVKSLALKLARRHGAFNVIEAHGFGLDGRAAMLIAQDLGAPLMVTAYESSQALMKMGTARRKQLAATAAAARLVLAQSNAQAEALAACGVPKRKILRLRLSAEPVANPAVTAEDVSAMRKRVGPGLDAPASAPLWVSVGPLTAERRHHLAVAAAAASPDAHLVILGDGPDREALRRQAATSGAAQRIRIISPEHAGEAADWRRAADLGLCFGEGPDNAQNCLNFLASGAPVLRLEDPDAEDVTGPTVAVAPQRLASSPGDGRALAGLATHLRGDDAESIMARRMDCVAAAEAWPAQASLDDVRFALSRAADDGASPDPASRNADGDGLSDDLPDGTAPQPLNRPGYAPPQVARGQRT